MATTVFTGELALAQSQLGLLELGGPVHKPTPTQMVTTATGQALALTPPRVRSVYPPRRSLLDVEIDDLPYKLHIPENPSADKKGVNIITEPVYLAEEVDPLLTRIGSGVELNYGDFPATIESVYAIEDWSSGLSPLRLNKLESSYWTAKGVDARRVHQVICSPAMIQVQATGNVNLAGVPIRAMDFSGAFYLAAGTTVYQLTGTPGQPSWTPVYTAAGTLSDLQVFGVSSAYAISGTSTSYLLAAWGTGYAYSTDGVTWVLGGQAGQTNADNTKADFFATVRFQLWKAVRPNKLYSCLDIANTASANNQWTSTANNVGDASQNITSLLGFNVDIAVGKTDGLWTIDRAGNDFPVIPELKFVANASNVNVLRTWRGGLHFNVRNGMYRYEPGRIESLGLDRYRATGTAGQPLVLKVADMSPFLNEMFVALSPSQGPTGMFLASFFEKPFRWHLIAYDARYKATFTGISDAAFSVPTLWWGQDDGQGNYATWYARLPAATDNPLDDTGYQYRLGSGVLTTTEIAPLADQNKTWAKVVLHCLQGSPQATVSLAYAADAAIETQTFTPMVGPQNQTSQWSLYQEWFFPGWKNQSTISSKSIQFQLTLSTTDTAQTPVVKHVVAHYKHRPQPRRRWKLQLVLEDQSAGRSHYRDRRSPDAMLHDLMNARLSSQPVKFLDMIGDQYQVYIEKVSHQLIEKRAQATHRYKAEVHLLEHLDNWNPVGAVGRSL